MLNIPFGLIYCKPSTYATSQFFTVIPLTINYGIEVLIYRPSRYCYFTNNNPSLDPNQLLQPYFAWNDPILAARPCEFYEKKFFRVAPTLFGSLNLNTPAPLYTTY